MLLLNTSRRHMIKNIEDDAEEGNLESAKNNQGM